MCFVLSLKEVPPWSSTTAPTASFSLLSLSLSLSLSLLKPTLFLFLRFLFATDQLIWKGERERCGPES
ncbi:hypothetical protein VNO77_33487 [Canavalia gladiata]|uniref:Uncharacterized protein n=1 Tax=Canavalia gladiata TaxID=3824 RepID=A0AAN9KCH3_CANGL